MINLHGIKDKMASEYSFRENVNLYGASFIGCVLPLATLRYSIFPAESNTVVEEALKWAQTGASIPGFLGISIGGWLGAKWGLNSSDRMQQQRLEEELAFN
jgi:hypothetical protein